MSTTARARTRAGDIAELQKKVDELTEQLAAARADAEREAQQRNFFQFERDRVYSLYEIAQKRLQDAETQLRNKDRETEELIEKHQVAIKSYQHRIKDLLYGHRQEAAQLRTDAEETLRQEQVEAEDREAAIRDDRRALKRQLRESEAASEEALRQLKAETERKISAMQQESDRRLREMAARYEARTRELTEELDLLRRTEVHEIEERKNAHISSLLRQHEQAYAEMKAYYSEVTTSNLDLIRSLKTELAEMRKKAAVSEKMLFEIAQENRALQTPLQEATRETEELRRQLAAATTDKQSLATLQAYATQLESQLKRREWESTNLARRLGEAQQQYEDMQSHFEAAVEDVEQRNAMREQLLERRLMTIGEVVEKKDTVIGELMAQAGVQGPEFESACARLDAVLAAKNAALRNVQGELQRVVRTYNEALASLGEQLLQSGGPAPEQLGFTPMMPPDAAAK